MPLDFLEVRKFLENAQQADSLKGDLRRALRKVSTAFDNLQTAVDEVQSLLSDDYQPTERKGRTPRESDPEAPFGRKADGSPKAKPGRAKQAETAE